MKTLTRQIDEKHTNYFFACFPSITQRFSFKSFILLMGDAREVKKQIKFSRKARASELPQFLRVDFKPNVLNVLYAIEM